MLSVLIVSQILSWIVILGLGVALLALARQVGVLHVRVAPAGAPLTGKGPVVCEPPPVLIGDKGAVLCKGLVRSREHLESLVTAHELGVVSVQDFLANPKTKVALS